VAIPLLPCSSSVQNWQRTINWLGCQSQSRSHITTDGQSVSKSWCRAPSAAYDQIFVTVWQLRSCWCGALSLTRGRVCRLQLLLVLASAVILGSEPLGTRDHILLSQIWDFPFRSLLRLAGSRWRYSTPPPYGSDLVASILFFITPRHGPRREHRSCSYANRFSLARECVYRVVAQKRVWYTRLSHDRCIATVHEMGRTCSAHELYEVKAYPQYIFGISSGKSILD
jgi:hypothetical protein